ncbi:hypothetical protein [Actinocrinis sp.]|uniref:hypothetical protein n=1 Tax=Actinocrinis sp. TaxID=1920516 RepID=UPI002D38C4D5|nr:hypothetical protein [Actinocrinis sp.]HZP54627.1 hypothetical protein [Actinocrinis sp.]
MTARDPHPAAIPAIHALGTLARWTPANATELARILESIHAYGQQSIISELLETLDNLASAAFGLEGLTPEQSRIIGQHLELAGSTISGAAHDWIDRARADTGAEWPR